MAGLDECQTKGYGRDRKNLFQREFLLQGGFNDPIKHFSMKKRKNKV